MSDSEEEQKASGGTSNISSGEPVHMVGIKMPTFMETAAAAWFNILEANFALRKITSDETKYFHVLAALPPDLVAKLSGFLLENRSYDNMKKEVISIYEKTKPELFDKLIKQTTMSGRPSHYLQDLKILAGKVNASDDLVKHQFFQALPSSISPALAAQKDLTLTQLGNLADELAPLVSNQILKVDARQAKFEKHPHGNSGSNFKKNSQNSSQSSVPLGIRPYSNDQRPKICRAHLYFGKKARTCKPWCEFPNRNSNVKIQPNSRSASPAPQGNPTGGQVTP